MSEHRVILVPGHEVQRRGYRGTAGIYGLADPRDLRVRYVGSSQCVERRLYAHAHSPERHIPRGRWILELLAAGVRPVALVLEAGDFGSPQSAQRHEAERRWIEMLQPKGGADLNVKLTPVGHTHSKDSPGKKLHAELSALRARVVELEAQIAEFRRCNTATCLQRCNTLRVALPDPMQRNATHPFRGVAVLQSERPNVAEICDLV